MVKVLSLYAHLEEIAGAALLVAMCVVAAVQVVGRYLLASPPAWTEEMATLLFAWLVFVGASLALKRNEHFALDVVVETPAWGIAANRAGLRADLMVLVFCALLIGYGVRLSLVSWNVQTAVLEIPRTWLYAAVPFGGVLMLLAHRGGARTLVEARAWRL